MSNTKIGHVYVLVSPKCEFVKIGGTDYPPNKRIKEINGGSPYRELGPWHLADFRQVTDWRKVEANLHFTFRSALVSDVIGQKELFRIAPQIVSSHLSQLNTELILKRPTIDRMFQDTDFANYLLNLFTFTGLLNWLDIQGAWTLVLFPATSGGRYFTINIGRHEVAFSQLPENASMTFWHMIIMDRLIYDFPEVRDWVKLHGGEFCDDNYVSGLARSVSVRFLASFDGSMKFLKLDGVRRALIAYWVEALIRLKERGTSSVFSRFHNWNAVAEINRRLIATN